MSMFFVAFAIIVIACACVAIRRNVGTKAAVVATTSVVAAKAAPVAHTQDVCDPINDCNAVDYSVMVALVYILMYTKTSLKANRLQGRRARSHTAHKAACARSHAAYAASADKRMEITLACKAKASVRIAKAKQEALERASNGNTLSETKRAARAAQGSAQRAANAARKLAQMANGKKVRVVRTTKVVRTGVPATKPAAKPMRSRSKPVRTYVRQAANKPTIISGTQLAQQASATGTSLAAQIRVAKTTLASLYAILPLARQVVALQRKADRKVGLYAWLSEEGHVGVRSTKSSIARRDAAQEVVCQAALAAEAFKEAYGIEATDVVPQILAAKAAKARAVEMLHDHKAEQHRLFLERQERRAAKAALRASKAAPAAAPAVTEVADWEEYVPVNAPIKAFAGLDVAIALVAA